MNVISGKKWRYLNYEDFFCPYFNIFHIISIVILRKLIPAPLLPIHYWSVENPRDKSQAKIFRDPICSYTEGELYIAIFSTPQPHRKSLFSPLNKAKIMCRPLGQYIWTGKLAILKAYRNVYCCSMCGFPQTHFQGHPHPDKCILRNCLMIEIWSYEIFNIHCEKRTPKTGLWLQWK